MQPVALWSDPVGQLLTLRSRVDALLARSVNPNERFERATSPLVKYHLDHRKDVSCTSTGVASEFYDIVYPREEEKQPSATRPPAASLEEHVTTLTYKGRRIRLTEALQYALKHHDVPCHRH